VRTNGDHGEDEDEEMLSPEDSEGTDEEYESEEDMVPPNHRSSMAGLTAFGMQPSPPFDSPLSRYRNSPTMIGLIA